MISRIMQTEAIVLRNLRFGDTSRVAVLFTRELGKVGVIGKGARDPKSPLGSSLELLTYSSFILYYKPGRDLQFLKSGEALREFRAILREPRRFMYGAAWVEYLDRVVLEEEPAEDLFALAVRGLEVIDTAAPAALPEFFRGLQLRVAVLLGYAPQLDACGRCGRVVPAASAPEVRGPEDAGRLHGSWVFSPAQGMIFCPSCAGFLEEVPIAVSERAVRRLRTLALGSARSGTVVRETADGPPWPSPLAAAWVAQLGGLVEEFLRYHMSAYRGLRSLEMVELGEAVGGGS